MQPSTVLLTAAALATALGVSKATILRRARDGSIPTHHLGARTVRFVLSEVLAATVDRPVTVAPHPKVSRLSQEDRDFFYGRQPRRAGRTSESTKKARRSS